MNEEIGDLEKLAHNEALESSPEYQRILPEVMKEVNAIVDDFGITGAFGVCHFIWRLQKDILKEKHNITWYTPQECHPCTCYD